MIDYHNLILVCYKHAFDVEWKEKKYTISKLREEIFEDVKKLNEFTFNFSESVLEEILFHFIEHHDPDRLSHMSINSPDGFVGVYGSRPIYEITCTGVRIVPTRHIIGGKFETISTKRKI